MVELRVLGPIEGFRDGRPVELGGPTQRRLLASLVAQPDQVVSVSTLLENLWGADPPPSGPASIQSYVSRLRRGLGPDVIQTISPGYRLGDCDLTIDSVEFLNIASDLPDDPASRLETIDQALSLWRGPPFEDFDHVDFASHRLSETRFDLQEAKARLLAAAGQSSSAVAVLERITAAEPLRESAWTTLGSLLAQMGRQADAVRALDRYRTQLNDIGLEPGPAFTAAETEVFETRPSTSPRPLPKPTTSFVGRERESNELSDLLEMNRLVTLVGPGGMGKTRLAMEVAGTWHGSEPIFVRLESLREDYEVAPALLHALSGETRGSPTESVIAKLSRMDSTLLVLDNAEHLIETTADLVTEVVSSTDSTVLVTAREPLNTPGEVILTLGPLDPNSAIALYRNRAKRVNPDFEAPAATLDMLCEEIDYMPLAIEMAAARSKALAPDEILTRLNRRYGLFDKPLRGAVARHRSLDAMVDWSYSLLDPISQRVFERLSVVAGTFDVDLAGSVAGFGVVPEEAVAGTLANLVEKSLIDRTRAGTYRMLRVLQSYAGERLETIGDYKEARTLHARWFGQLGAQTGKGLSTPAETVWIDRANAAVDDLASALSWSAETGDLDTTQLILEGLFDWFYHRQPPAIARWGHEVLRYSEGHDVHSVATAWAALAAMKAGNLSEARDLTISGTKVDGVAGRFAWFLAGELACYQDRLEDALDAYRTQRELAVGMTDRIGVIDAMAGESLAFAFRGMFDEAMDIAVDLDEVATDIGAPTYRAYSYYTYGEAMIDSDPEGSADRLEQAVALATSVNNQFIQALARTTLGSVLARLGRMDDARTQLRQALEMWENIGLHAYRWRTVQYLAAVLAEEGNRESAAKLLAAAEKEGRGPFSAGQSHWTDVVANLKADADYESWASEGVLLGLDEASEMALAATQPRR